jgi:hypothetical protein
VPVAVVVAPMAFELLESPEGRNLADRFFRHGQDLGVLSPAQNDGSRRGGATARGRIARLVCGADHYKCNSTMRLSVTLSPRP